MPSGREQAWRRVGEGHRAGEAVQPMGAGGRAVLRSRPFDMVRTALARVQEALNVSEIDRAGSGEQPRKAGRPAEAVERVAEGRGGVTASARGGHRPGEPGGSVCAAGAGAVAARVPGRGPAGPEGEEPDGRVSAATDRTYPLTMVCETWRVARSSVYALRAQVGGALASDRIHIDGRSYRLREIDGLLRSSNATGRGTREEPRTPFVELKR